MKKSILLFSAFLLTLNAAFSQAPIYTETFGAGIPVGWINAGVDKNGAAHTDLWKYTKTGNHGYAATRKIASPTQADGFIIFDSDSMDNAGGGAQASGTTPAGQRGYLTSTPYSFVGHSHVLLQFYQLFYNYDANTRVIVSNGTNSDTIEVNPTLSYLFAGTTNPDFKQYDISAIAANHAAVTITFLWDLTRDGYYYWQIDDVSFLDAPANDLQITQSGSYDYNIYPVSEVDSFSYYAIVNNVGSVAQPNTKVALTVKKGASVVFTDTSAPVNLLPGIDSAIVGAKFYPQLPNVQSSIGTYTTIVSTFSDSVGQIPYHNADTTKFAISDSVYAVDNGLFGGSQITFLPAQYSSSGNSASQEWATIFHLPYADTLTSVTAAFDNVYSSVGAIVQANVYELPADYPAGPTNVFPVNPLLKTETKLLTAAFLPDPSTVGAGVIRPVNLKIDKTTGNPVLPAGWYALSIVGTNDSLVSIINGSAGSGAYGLPGGIIQGGSSLTAYSDTRFYLRMNLGHGLNTLYCNFSRTPSGTVRQNNAVVFTGSSNGGATTAVYTWDFTSTQGYTYPSQTGKIVRDTFPFVDSILVCLTVTDGGSSATTCKSVVIRPALGVTEVSALTETTLSPNPTTGRVTIAASNVSGPVAISITNLLGESVASFNETANGSFEKAYDLSSLSSGVYIVKIQNGNNTSAKRLTVSK